MIQEFIKKPLAEELLFGKLVKGGAVKVNLVDDALSFDIAETPVSAVQPKPEGEGEAEKEPEATAE